MAYRATNGIIALADWGLSVSNHFAGETFFTYTLVVRMLSRIYIYIYIYCNHCMHSFVTERRLIDILFNVVYILMQKQLCK